MTTIHVYMKITTISQTIVYGVCAIILFLVLQDERLTTKISFQFVFLSVKNYFVFIFTRTALFENERIGCGVNGLISFNGVQLYQQNKMNDYYILKQNHIYF